MLAACVFLLEGTTAISLILLHWHVKQSCLLSLMLQVLGETLETAIIFYSGAEVVLAVGNLPGKSVSEFSQLLCQRCSANLREKNRAYK